VTCCCAAGPRDGEVLSHIALDESLALRTGTEIEHYVRTGECQQPRGVGMTEPFRRLRIYDHRDTG
jgi:hypothetical protein